MDAKYRIKILRLIERALFFIKVVLNKQHSGWEIYLMSGMSLSVHRMAEIYLFEEKPGAFKIDAVIKEEEIPEEFLFG